MILRIRHPGHPPRDTPNVPAVGRLSGWRGISGTFVSPRVTVPHRSKAELEARKRAAKAEEERAAKIRAELARDPDGARCGAAMRRGETCGRRPHPLRGRGDGHRSVWSVQKDVMRRRSARTA